MFPAYNGIQDQGRRSRHGGINHPAEIQWDRHPYIWYFEDLSASGGLKFEPNVPPMEGGKKGHF